MAAGFKLHNPIVITFDKSEYGVGDTVRMTVNYSVDVQGLFYGSMYYTLAEVWSGGNLIDRAGDQHTYLSVGGVETDESEHSFEFDAEEPGTFSGDVRIFPKSGIKPPGL